MLFRSPDTVQQASAAALSIERLSLQENLSKGGLNGRSAQGKRSRTRAVNGIDGDIKLNRALWVMAEELQQALS